MARILRDGEWYEPIAPTSIYESDFQGMIVAQAQHIFPDYAVVAFDKIVESEHGTAKADLALVDRRYRFWWVVEIELSTHSLEGHVRPQVQTLSSAAYGPDEASYISDRSPDLDPSKVQQMMKGSQPRVLVVVNAPMPYWQMSLASLGAIVAVVEVYRSDKNRLVFRLNGGYPTLPHNFVSHCHLDSALPKLMVVESPGALPQTSDPRLTIRFEGGVTRWLRVESGDTVWLIPDGPLGLEQRARYVLMLGEDGGLDLVKEQ